MKIYSKLSIDIASGDVIESESFDYVGPVAWAGPKSKQKSSVVTNVAAPSAQELRTQQIGNLVQQQQLSDSGYELKDDGSGNLSLAKRALTPDEQKDADFQGKLRQQMEESITGIVSPEKQAQIDATYANYETKGNASIDQYARELAGARGLDLNTDTPALREALKARGELQGTLGAAKAEAGFNYGNQQQQFAQSLNQFQQGLKQQAFSNRQGISDSANTMASQMANNRYATANKTTTSSSTSPGLFSSLANGFASGLGQGLGSRSSRDFKENIIPADLSLILEEIAATPIYEWNYKAEFDDPSRRHIGPVIEEASPRISEGKMLVPVDYMGYLFGAIKALNEKVNRLEANATTV